MSIKLRLPKLTDLRPRLTVIGVGGAGCNAINNMIAAGLTGIDFVVANTDAQALAASSAEHRLQLGANLTEGLGAGSKPEIGEAAAEEAIDDIRAQVSGSHMVFVAAGMGGGTGTGAASVIARVAKDLGILTVGVVTKPFLFEGARRMRIAEAGVAELKKIVDTLIVIPNQNLFRLANEKTTFSEAFVLADQVLYSGVACIVDLIIKEGLINLDFADVRTVLSGMGTAMMGTGEAAGERRAVLAAEEAISNPLLDDVSLQGAKGLLLSITGGTDLTLYEVDEAASRVREEVDDDANIIVGATFDKSLEDRVRVSIVASGMARPAAFQWPANLGGGASSDAGSGGVASGNQPSWNSLAGQGTHGDARDVQRRLSAALQSGDGDNHGGSTGSQGQSAWGALGDVVIEEGLPQFVHSSPSPSQHTAMAGNAHTNPESFQPAAPAEIRRQQRRMPEVEDFSPLAQLEYRHKNEKAGHGKGGEKNNSAQRRPSLLARLTGRARRSSDSRMDGDRSESHATRQPGQGQNVSAQATQAGAHDERREDMTRQHQDTDLPMFFSRSQK